MTASPAIAVGQRWLSDAEPELGLGLVVGVDGRVIHLAFAAADETRRYVVGSSPLRRVRFAVGDVVADEAGRTHRVEAVEERGGVLFYRSGATELPEARVAAKTAVTGPRERLAAGRVDASRHFDLRAETLERLHRIRSSPVRGFVGPRIELLPHQFSVAADVSSRLLPRVLLADETGLGKTIEAGLILSRLVLSGRASRVLVLVPDALVNQWLVELRRRFQIRVAVYDEDRCAAHEESEPGANPFVQEQLVLAGLSLVATSAKRTAQAAEAGWDVVVVDEAHHLEWSRRGASPGYVAVETIARGSSGLLLLTATPEQLGAEGHFARLRLLDPDRYGDYDAWLREAEGWRDAARVAASLAAGKELSKEEADELARVAGLDAAEVARRTGDPSARSALLAELIDRHGPGRVMFRNTRAAVSGFPERRVHRHELDGADAARVEKLQAELAEDLGGNAAGTDGGIDLHGDPRVQWLVRLLGPKGPQKVLVLCRTGAKAEALGAAVSARLRVATALFHEGLTLLQRDRNAAWFAEEDGARLMICSELGSEGRNFQHAQHLVLFDVPLDPDLVEQRIGRLDRIGQKGTVEVHLPYVPGTGAEVVVRWLDEGIGSLMRPTLAARPLLERFGDEVRELALAAPSLAPAESARRIADLAARTAEAALELAERIERGRDRLLEMASLRPELANPLIDAVRALDADTGFEEFFLRLLEHFHVYGEEIAPRCVHLNPDGTRSPEFPSLDRGETVLAFDRAAALVREDLLFATSDSPLLGDAMEALLASPAGNAAFALLDDKGPPRLWLEAIYVLEPVAPARLHADRFLAPAPVRIVVDQHGAEPKPGEDPADADLADGRGDWIASKQKTIAPLVAKLGDRVAELAEKQAAERRAAAVAAANAQLGGELERLRALAAVNDAVRPEEFEALEAERAELEAALAGARLRPDALRLIWQGPTKQGAPAL